MTNVMWSNYHLKTCKLFYLNLCSFNMSFMNNLTITSKYYKFFGRSDHMTFYKLR